MADPRPIGFFDSGVGLISVLSETKKLLPHENFVIYADQIHNPYGERSEKQIKSYATAATDFLVKKHKIKMMVLACNTATVLALDHLRREFDLPFVGTVPAIKPAVVRSKNKRIAIMSTPATARSKYLNDLVKKYAKGAQILKIGCDGLEEAIEILDKTQIIKLIRKFAKKIKEFKADTVVLGCTHYPLFKKEISDGLGRRAEIIDSGEAIAKQIKRVLQDSGLTSQRRTGDVYYTTGDVSIFSKITSRILKQKIKSRQTQLS